MTVESLFILSLNLPLLLLLLFSLWLPNGKILCSEQINTQKESTHLNELE
jgi:hypothetical protein